MNQVQFQQEKPVDMVVDQCSKPEDGFQSQQQYEEEILYNGQEDWRQMLKINDQKTDLKLRDSAKQISKKTYSLQPDMITGWTPKVPMNKPIPLKFNNCIFDSLFDCYLKSYNKKKQDKAKLCFLGARYQTTYYAWYQKQFQFPYKHLTAPKIIQITDRYFCGQHWDAQNTDCLHFDSLFEGGNLDAAFKVGNHEYDLFMRVDSNTRGHLQWYNFKVKNMFVGTVYRFNICNFQKSKNLYSRGMSPYFYSLRRFIEKNIKWTQTQGKTKYRRKTSKVQNFLQYQSDDVNIMLSFEFEPEYENDQIQFSYCIPYNYSTLIKKIDDMLQNYQHLNILKSKKLCSSLGGLNIPELTITDDATNEEQKTNNKIKIQNKKIIFITGRCHPGQSNGSWMVDGLLDFLCSNTQQAKMLREHTIIKIIPMVNPDGVVIGNYRTGLSGKDFNRQFVNPDKTVFPQIYHLKQMFWRYKQIYQNDALIYLDFHGHSVKKNAFAYGPQYSIIHKYYYQSRLIPKMINAKTSLFRYYSCIFKISEQKQKTGRAIFLRNFRIPFTYTIQASNGFHYSQQNFKNETFTAEKWQSLGQNIMRGISQYIKAIIQLQKIRAQKMRERKIIKQRSYKPKYTKSGPTSSLGFRKSKPIIIEEQTTIADLIKNSKMDKQFEQLVRQIKTQNQNQHDKISDDQISQGSSDSQGSKDDLDNEQMQNLISAIKQRQKNEKKSKKINQQINFKVKHCKTMYQQNFIQQNDEQKQTKMDKKRTSNKDLLMKKYLLKKKNSICTTPSPKKQQSRNNNGVARIVNFSFSIKPTEISLTKKTNQSHKYQQKKLNEELIKQKYTQISNGDLSLGKKNKPYEYSETFKKSFMSVQKQILRRQSQKRYLVALNNTANQNKSKPSYLIENTKYKRINTDFN